jgi:site-specific DNA-methyltransferase (adenine-specific)
MQLIHGDCLEKMKDIPDKSIDMILCDLPYGTTQNKWDSIIDLSSLWEQYNRVLKPNGACVLFCAQPFTSVLVTSNIASFKYEWCWKKPKGTGHLNAKKKNSQ